MTGHPHPKDDVVLAGVKATPFGWPAASLDPDCGRRRKQLAGAGGSIIHKFRSLRFQGIARVSDELSGAGVKDSASIGATSPSPSCSRRRS
jgi:hypothetical protein